MRNIICHMALHPEVICKITFVDENAKKIDLNIALQNQGY